MLSTLTNLRCCDAYLRSAGGAQKRRTSDSISPGSQSTRFRLRVLVVEFRDEVYAGLRALLDEHGFEVQRAESGSTVAHTFNHFVPDLILLNEDMPDESGWLITCKLRLTRHRQPVWLYTDRQPRFKADWKEHYGIDELIEYGGVLTRLVQRVRQVVAKWLSGPDREPSHHEPHWNATLFVA